MNDTIDRAEIFWHKYKYYPYEKELAYRELVSIFKSSDIEVKKDYISVYGAITPEKVKELVYFSKGKINGSELLTTQKKIENGYLDKSKKQNTRYSAHGLHEYKGKFNPQVVQALLNIFNVNPRHLVLDPFCGSGTTITECAHRGILSIGADINPLAVKISNAKIRAVNTNVDLLEITLNLVCEKFLNGLKKKVSISQEDSVRVEYLKKWFDEDTFYKIELYRQIVENIDSSLKDILLILGSNLLRDYSLQEPSDLRIRRRISPMPNISFEDNLQNAIANFVLSIRNSQSIIGVKESNNFAVNQDITSFDSDFIIKDDSVDFAITSPPYATALPYIDTQRLSLVWLNLISPEDIRPLEGNLIGSREFSKKIQLFEWNEKLDKNSENLPDEVFNLCVNLKKSLSDNDGFRRQAVPALMYRYFSNMKSAFISIRNKLKKDSFFTLIVGHNTTTLGGNKIEINTPEMLGIIGSQVNFEFTENMELQTYQRYGLHYSNSVNRESLIVLRKK